MSEKALKVLLVEDNAGDARLLREFLAEKGPEELLLTHVTSLAEALHHLTNGGMDAALLDLGLPDSHGLETVRQAHSAAPDLPLVVLSGLNDEAIAVQSLQEGAQDYLTKGRIDGNSILRAIRYAIERQRMQASLRSVALFDDLTGLYNRRGFLSFAEHNRKLSRRTGEGFALVFLDLDGLKQINDTLGHNQGNQALVEMAEVLKESFRQSDVLCRLGGDEFAVFMMDASADSTEIVRQRLSAKLQARSREPGRRFQLSFSIGILCCHPDEARPMEDLLAAADSLMYVEKKVKQAFPKAAGKVMIRQTR